MNFFNNFNNNSYLGLILFVSFILLALIVIMTGVIFFRLISNQALKNNNTVFLDLANSNFEKREQAMDHLIKPLKESLEKFDAKIQDIEKSRIGAYATLSQQVKSLLETQMQLRAETTHLANALRKPHSRGRWGEIQLQRVVELAGMLEYCDFYQQPVSDPDPANNSVKPDLIIRLPGGKNIIVDAKVSLASFLDALEPGNEITQKQKLQDHARHIRDHINKLSQKNYWQRFKHSLEFVILFLPGETFFSAALEADPALIEKSVEKRVIIATPMTLIALLKTIAYGWRQEKLAENTEQISEMGKELANRLNGMHDHFTELGDKIHKTVQSYNKTIGALESHVLSSARKFQTMNNMKEKAILNTINLIPRAVKKNETLA